MIPTWTTRRDEKRRRLSAIEPEMRGSFLPTKKIVPALETLVASGDRIVIEGIQKVRPGSKVRPMTQSAGLDSVNKR